MRRPHAPAVSVVCACAALVAACGGAARTGPSAKRAASHGPPSHATRPPSRPTLPDEAATNRRILAYTSYVAGGSGRAPDVALTFDDGPGPWTPKVLHVLERLHARATFFEIGREVRAYPRYTAELARAGMAIGDHTETHPFMGELSPDAQAAQLDEAARAIEAAGAPRPLLFRPPYGSFDATTLDLLPPRDMVMVLWTGDTKDYSQPGVSRIRYTAISGGRPGAIVLMHDGGGDRAQTVAALPRIIERLRQRGFRLVTVPQLLRDDPPPRGQPPPRPLSGGG